MLFAIYDLETGEETELQTNLWMIFAIQMQRARWSPDGKSLLIQGGIHAVVFPVSTFLILRQGREHRYWRRKLQSTREQ